MHIVSAAGRVTLCSKIWMTEGFTHKPIYVTSNTAFHLENIRSKNLMHYMFMRKYVGLVLCPPSINVFFSCKILV